MLDNFYNEHCLDTMRRMEDNSIDCVITSPPYNVCIDYDEYDDNRTEEEYFDEMRNIFSVLYSKLKNDGRLALNIPFETSGIDNQQDRLFLASEFWNMLKEIGYKWAGFVRLVEDSPQVAKRISQWGSWLSPSAPYLFNSEECVLILYKNQWKKESRGTPYWNEDNKREFIDLVRFGWKYKPDMNQLTKATFSVDLPLSALKLLTWQEDLIYDPFMGSGTTAIACEMLKRKWIGSELSTSYHRKACLRIKDHVDIKWSARAFFDI